MSETAESSSTGLSSSTRSSPLTCFCLEIPADRFPDNVVARDGDALSLDEPADTYDTVLHSYLDHHLVGDSASALVGNVQYRRSPRPSGC